MRPRTDSTRLTAIGLLAAGVVTGSLATVGLVVLADRLFPEQTNASPLGAPRFVEETAEDGIDHVYDGEFLYFVGGGVAVFDCDRDGLPELFLAGGERPAGLFENRSDSGGPLRFEEVTDEGLAIEGVTGAYPLDVDSDGITDLAVLRVGENMMLRGLGDCRFEPANELWGVDGGEEWTASFSATWEPGEALPTLAFGNYLQLDEEGGRADECADHFLVRPEGSAYRSPDRLSPGWCTLSILFSDWGHSGRRDLRMTNDRHYYRDGEEQLWRVEAGRPPRLYTRDDGWEHIQIWGMGIASQDITGDGLPEVYLTSQGDNKLQTLVNGRKRPSYTDIALESGANAHRPFQGDTDRPSTAWHAEFDDVNNDGFTDLFVTKGNVEAMAEFARDDPNNLLLGRPGPSFVEAADEAGLIDYSRSRGGAVADLNLDGLLDVVVVDRREQVRLWRNLGSGDGPGPGRMGNWIALQLEQAKVNRDAIGAWIEVRAGDGTWTREVTVGGGHAGGQLGWHHFGIGASEVARVRVEWPDGQTGPWLTVEAGRLWLVERGSSEPSEWRPLQD